jgi:hypothetical protein
MFTNFIQYINSHLTIAVLLFRHLKTWIRNRMRNGRLSNVWLVNIHRQRHDDKIMFINKLVILEDLGKKKIIIRKYSSKQSWQQGLPFP